MGSNGVKSKHLTLSLLACVQQPYREWIVFDESAAPPQHNPARRKVRQSPAAIYFPPPKSSTSLHSLRAVPFRHAQSVASNRPDLFWLLFLIALPDHLKASRCLLT